MYCMITWLSPDHHMIQTLLSLCLVFAFPVLESLIWFSSTSGCSLTAGLVEVLDWARWLLLPLEFFNWDNSVFTSSSSFFRLSTFELSRHYKRTSQTLTAMWLLQIIISHNHGYLLCISQSLPEHFVDILLSHYGTFSCTNKMWNDRNIHSTQLSSSTCHPAQ